MCSANTTVSHQFSLAPVLLRGSKIPSKRREKAVQKYFSSKSLSNKSQLTKSEMIMASECCPNCFVTSTVIAAGECAARHCKSSSCTDVCPYCRSVRNELAVCEGNVQCSQATNPHKLSSEIHQNFCNYDSQLEYSSGPCEGLVPSDLCRCAKNITLTRSQPFTTKPNHYTSNDGWRALRLVLLGILVALPTSTMSSPLNHHLQRSGSPRSSGHHGHHSPHRGNEGPMKWINPCRIPTSIPTQASEIQMPTQSDEEIFQNIVTQAKKAEVQARLFFEDFRNECFGEGGHDYQQLHYDWLKDVAEKVGKNLGDPVEPTRLETFEVEDILQSMYRGLQKLAVGLEQVVLDQAFHGGSFYQHFHEAEFQLKYVLCEFQIAMMEKNIQYEDVTREIMDKSFVNLDDKTWRNLRDFSIFRDYLNTLEFIRGSFEHFWKLSKQAS